MNFNLFRRRKAVEPSQDLREFYLMLEPLWVAFENTQRSHPIYAKKSGVKYQGYESLNQYMDALKKQNAVIADAMEQLRIIRKYLYGNPWGAK